MTNLLSNQISLIYNPHAGFGHWDGTVRRIANFWQNQGWEVMICPTARPGHATELARRAAEMQHGLVLAAGGDGTLNEVANGLAHTETILAPLPVGTGNSFAKELRMPRPTLVDWGQLQQASEALLQGTIHQMDLGRTGDGRYWLLWVGTGLDGFVIDQIEPRSKIFKQLGPAGYAAKALFFLPNFPTMRATVMVESSNGPRYETQDDFMMISICNCRLFAGGEVRLNATAVLDDGQFEVWLFRGQQWPTMMRYVLEIGLENHADDPSIDMIRGTSVTVESTPNMPYHVDGEPTADTPFSCELIPNALRLLVPQTAQRGLFKKVGTPLSNKLLVRDAPKVQPLAILLGLLWLALSMGTAQAAPLRASATAPVASPVTSPVTSPSAARVASSIAAPSAVPPVDPLTATCEEGNFLHIQTGRCLPLHTTYGFDGFPEPRDEIQLESCSVQELRRAVSVGNRTVLLRAGCTYDLGRRDLSIQSNTIIEGGGAWLQNHEAASQKTDGAETTSNETAGETMLTCTGTTAFRIHDVSNVIIRNLTINGMNNQRNNSGCGTLVFIDEGADNVLVERVRMKNGLGKGVGFRTASRVTVRYSWVEDMWDDHGLNADKHFVDIAYYSNYITNVGISSDKIGYGINSHATKAEIAGNFIEDTDSGIKLMGARYTLLHHNTIIGASSRNPLYRGVWTAIDNKDNVRPETIVYYENFIDTDGVRPFSVLDGATDIYFAGNHYGNVSNFIPISSGSSVYRCVKTTDARLSGNLLDIEARKVSFLDSGMGEFDPCELQSLVDGGTNGAGAKVASNLAPSISQDLDSQRLVEGQVATFSVVSVGSGTLTYQWQRRFGSGKWFNIYNATQPTYSSRPLRSYNNGNQYRVKIQSEFGNTLSKVATITVDPVAPCVTASSRWQSRPMLAQQGRFSSSFLAKSPTAKSDGLIGMGSGAATRFSDMAVTVRFAPSGHIDVRNGSSYDADERVAYEPGETLHFRVEVDIGKRVYSVYVAPYTDSISGTSSNTNSGTSSIGKEVEVADDYAFRSEQMAVKRLDSWSFWDGNGRIEVCELTP